MKTLIIIAITILATVTFAQARLGETREQCERRYGNPLGADDGLVLYRTAAFRILISYTDGRAAAIHYSKFEGDKMDANMAALLIKRNIPQESAEWDHKGTGADGNETGITTDGKYIYAWGGEDGTLLLATKEFAVAVKKEEADKRKKATQGL